MATIEHALYCFESLAANLEKRSPMTLSQVQSSYANYQLSLANQSSSLPLKNPVLAHLSPSGTSTPSSTSSSSLEPSTAATTPNSSSTSLEIDESPLFVTWNTVDSNGTSLRGCIGTFESLPLSTGLSSYALTSALQDTRFSPISLRELPTLSVAVTLLTDFETAEGGPLDWELGGHGIRISFVTKGRRYGACYLPDVATEQGWTKEETMVSLMRKAGWSGKRDKWRDVGDIKVVRFRGDALALEYAEFKEWRAFVEKK